MKKFYYTIGEVGKLLDLKQYVIRYWETEFPQLHPRKEKGRNRKYSEEDIEILRMIKDMLYNQKYTIDGARQKLKNQSKTKKMDQLEFTFQQENQPIQEISNVPANMSQILDSIRSRLNEFSKELYSFRQKWNVDSSSKSNHKED
ncbi:MAG TPA: MerR family transcriptional regulator [Candidatus Cloacimonadota bacterium]|nr:MerR family transcriptional regulator [Candidatus Cloacimonadota bacterium]HPT71430.1 MerR family transcriptional regulator [Candidatus Cloacimonadota bacterium]